MVEIVSGAVVVMVGVGFGVVDVASRVVVVSKVELGPSVVVVSSEQVIFLGSQAVPFPKSLHCTPTKSLSSYSQRNEMIVPTGKTDPLMVML